MARSVITRFYDKWVILLSYLQSPLLLAMRLYWGYHFFLTGKGKLLDIYTFVTRFANWHVPMPRISVICAGTTECFGGLLLLLGLGSRIVTVPLIFTMCVAYLTAEREKLNLIFSDPDKFVTADPFLFLLCCVIVLVFGPGLFSVDGAIGYAKGHRD
jgi:putative oxidoreductase